MSRNPSDFRINTLGCVSQPSGDFRLLCDLPLVLNPRQTWSKRFAASEGQSGKADYGCHAYNAIRVAAMLLQACLNLVLMLSQAPVCLYSDRDGTATVAPLMPYVSSA